MSRFPDVHPDDIDPETGAPYAGYSSPALDTSFHDAEMAGEEDDDATGAALKLAERALVSAYGEPKPGASMQSALGVRAIAAVRREIAETSRQRFDFVFLTGEDETDLSPPCSSREGHRWVVRDDNEEVSYCENCGADGNA